MRQRLSQEELTYLGSRRVGHLSTASAACEPHVVPVFFVYSDGVIWMSAGSKTRKIKNLQENGRAAIVIDEYRKTPHRERGFLFAGSAEVFRSGDSFERGIVSIRQKYEDYDPRSVPPSEGEVRVVKMTVDSVAKWGFGE